MNPEVYLQTANGKIIPVPTGEAIIGRQPDNPIAIEGQGVSRQHAKLLRQGNQVTLTDLNSSNGTYVNGQKLAPHTSKPLQSGDQLQIGSQFTFRFMIANEPETVLSDQPFNANSCPHCHAMNDLGARFCGVCGKNMSSSFNPPQSIPKPMIWLGVGAIVIVALFMGVGGVSYILMSGTLKATNTLWIAARTIDDKDSSMLYVFQPLTGEKHKLAEGDRKENLQAPLAALYSTIAPDQPPTWFNSFNELYNVSLSSTGGVSGYVLPNNQKVIYELFQDDAWELVLADINGENRQTLVRNATRLEVIVDPTDNQIIANITDEDKLHSAELFSSVDGQRIGQPFQDVTEGFAIPSLVSNKVYKFTIIEEESIAVIVNPDGSNQVELFRNKKEAIKNIHFLPPTEEQMLYANETGLYLAKTNGSETRELRRGEKIVIEAIAPQGDYVFISQVDSEAKQDLYLLRLADGQLVDLARHVDAAQGLFTPDGQKLLYYSQKEGKIDLMLHFVAKADSLKLVRDASEIGFFLPNDGRYYAYVTQPTADGKRRLNVVDTTDGQIFDVPQARDDHVTPFDLENGQLLFAIGEENSTERALYLHQFQQTSSPVLLDDQGIYLDARLLDNGRKIMFAAKFGNNSGAIYRVNADGKERQLLLDNATTFSELTNSYDMP